MRREAQRLGLRGWMRNRGDGVQGRRASAAKCVSVNVIVFLVTHDAKKAIEKAERLVSLEDAESVAQGSASVLRGGSNGSAEGTFRGETP